MRSKLSVTVYLFLALYGSTTLQSWSFLKNIKNFLCKKILVNNCSIPSTHAERKITVRSHKHSFTPYPSLSPYWPTEWQTDRDQIHLLHMGWRNLFSSSGYFSGQHVIWDLAGTGTTLFSGGLFWDQFFRLKIFFGAHFRYKLMYYNLYHVSYLREIVQFLRKVECIQFECNKFVLVLVQIDLIHFEHSNCISSTWTKTNTNPLHSRSIHSILGKIEHVIQIVVHQFVRKTISTFKLY